MDQYVGLYIIKEVISISTNTVKLNTMRIYPVVNVSWVVKYRELVKEQRVEKPKLVKVDSEEKWKIKRKLNKQKNKENSKLLSRLKRVYSKTWYIRERRELRKCKKSNSGLWEKNEYKS